MLDRTNTTVDWRIRAAGSDDLGFVRAVARVLEQQHQPALTATTAQWWSAINQRLVDVRIATDNNNKVVGMAATTRLPLSRTVELLALFVAPSYRRCGIGTQLLRYVLGKAGNATIRVNVQRNNDAARAVLRAAAFAVSDTELMVRLHE